MSAANYLPQFQGLRAVAFMAIFASHLFGFGALGAWGVSVFFTLSGFLMVYSHWFQEKEPSFGIRFPREKIRKLYPLHIAAMAGCALIPCAPYCAAREAAGSWPSPWRCTPP